MQVVVAAESGGALGGLVRQLSIDQFENEGRRVSYGTPDNASYARRLLDRQMSISGVQKKVCRNSSRLSLFAHVYRTMCKQNSRDICCHFLLIMTSSTLPSILTHGFSFMTCFCKFCSVQVCLEVEKCVFNSMLKTELVFYIRCPLISIDFCAGPVILA